MEMLLAVFRSRTQTLMFADAMRRRGIYVEVVPTPSAAKVGCGVSAKFRSNDLAAAMKIIGRWQSSLFGVFEMRRRRGALSLVRVM